MRRQALAVEADVSVREDVDRDAHFTAFRHLTNGAFPLSRRASRPLERNVSRLATRRVEKAKTMEPTYQ